MRRPENLPEFRKPPLTEVVLGIQFTPALGYQQIMAGEVWALFRKEFPHAQELPALAPTFETFGLPFAQQLSIDIASPAHDRFWFLSENKDELIQFQNDRLLHNWRKFENRQSVYPRFEAIFKKFGAEMKALETYFSELQPQRLNITQCEVSYINNIPLNEEKCSSSNDWLRFLIFESLQPDEFTFKFRRAITDSTGSRRGRLYCDAAVAYDSNEQKLIVLTLTARGIPKDPNIDAALEFLVQGRQMVVNLFAEVTTESAHRAWERVR